jgi:nucleoside-diphosphate-sugar epimerase
LETAISFNTDTFFNTDTVLPPDLNPYSISKKQFLDWGIYLAKRNIIRFVNIKLEHIFGAGDDESKFVTYLINNCLNNVKELNLTKGEQKRDFIHVDEVVAIYQLLLKKVKEKQDFYQEYSVGSGKAIAIRDLVEMIHRLTQSKTILNFGALPYRDGEVMFSEADTQALRYLGYIVSSDLEKSLKQTLNLKEKYSK